MRQTFKLGRVSGVPIGMHWSVLVIMVLLAQGLAMNLLPAAAPGLPELTYWLVALVVTVFFLAALLAHEAAHALMARHFGMRVKAITLWLLGGVAQLEGEPPHARGDFLIALVGPLTSLGASILFGLGMLAASAGGASPITVAALAWLAVVNLVLAVFNMLPGAPLDGGRVLRAAIWWIKGDRLAAQRISGRAGVVVGTLMIGVGIFEVIFTSSLSGLWLVLIGWFLVGAARAEDLEARLRERLAGRSVSELMSAPAATAGESQTIASFVDSVARSRPHRAFPVLSLDGRFTGLVSLPRLARVPVDQRATVRIADVMTGHSEVLTLAPDALVPEVALKVLTNPHRLAVVIDGSAVIGVLTASDIAKAMELANLSTPSS